MTIVDKLQRVVELAEKANTIALFSDWDDDALRTAHENGGGLAKVIYDLQCRYSGPHHEEVCVRLIENAIKIASQPAMARALLALWPALEELDRDAFLGSYRVGNVRKAFETAKKELEAM